MSAWINVEYYVLSSMASLALNSIMSQDAGHGIRDRQPVAANDDSSLLGSLYGSYFVCFFLDNKIPGAFPPNITLSAFRKMFLN